MWRARPASRISPAATGSTSEDAVRALSDLPLEAMIDMGDFAGGLLKYLREHPVPKLTIAGGFGKMVKLAQGAMDLHSGRSQVDFELACRQTSAGACSRCVVSQYRSARAGDVPPRRDLTSRDWSRARPVETALQTLRDAPVAVDILIVDSIRIGHRPCRLERVLIFGGTREARELADLLTADGFEVRQRLPA